MAILTHRIVVSYAHNLASRFPMALSHDRDGPPSPGLEESLLPSNAASYFRMPQGLCLRACLPPQARAGGKIYENNHAGKVDLGMMAAKPSITPPW